ncbi:TPA: hypothetical protein P2N04_001061 [Aeromonas salmonicida]|uniref:Uncharacterized protein n=1 Tax=Aeromonas salmonicida subsp. salmonicida TaxID=29491 RepID=A0A8F3IUT8_AERSS|nr:hypothetical protein [Aeromonas salmonicida]MBM9522644.1 hypothetical protein [Aeromonas salmonicida subsp. salmonicida]QWY91795.1 hypothetical protein [Aeromonas salmonicida subsp. salmonicida]HDN9804007.1 hypothetical protein [Aeromonas salmonicida]HDO0961091.1 hypothetical protein [Aeromonas salmonicida]HDO0965718.1 hypothetical protein [Aeromonas salmonicida]
MKNADMPAMPAGVQLDNDDPESMFHPHGIMQCAGLTKREEFAKAAMQGLLAGGYCVSDGDARYRLKDVPTEAMNLADALLAELEKQNDQ